MSTRLSPGQRLQVRATDLAATLTHGISFVLTLTVETDRRLNLITEG
jgi:hypothetical protein